MEEVSIDHSNIFGSVMSNTGGGGDDDRQILRWAHRLSDSPDEEAPKQQQQQQQEEEADDEKDMPSLGFFGASLNAAVLPSRLQWVAKHSVPPLLEATLRGVSQVVIVNNPTSGLVIMLAILIDNPWMAIIAFATTMFSTWVAGNFFVDTAYVKNGLAGYNAMLVACAFSVFLGNGDWHFGTVVAALFGGLCSSILNMSLKAMMDTVPTWTLAFNLVTLPGLAYSLPALAAAVTPVETIIQSELYKAGLINVTDSLITAVEVTHEETVAASTNSVLLSPLIGVSQIFVVNNAWSGALMLLGMALESRGIAAAAVIGSCIGCICGAYVGGEIGITDGLWGFNSSLAAVAVAVFFVPTWTAVAVAVVGSMSAAVLFAGMATAMGNAFSTPCLTLPFCMIATICHLLLTDGDIKGCIGARDPIAPEANYAAWQAELKEKAEEKNAIEAKQKASQLEAASIGQEIPTFENDLERARAAVLRKEANDRARVFYGPSTVQPQGASKTPVVDRAPGNHPAPGDKHQPLSSTDSHQKHRGPAESKSAADGQERPRRPGGRSIDELNGTELATMKSQELEGESSAYLSTSSVLDASL